MDVAVADAPAVASEEEVRWATQYIEDLTTTDEHEIVWSVGLVCSIRPDPNLDSSDALFIERLDRVERRIRQQQRQAFDVGLKVDRAYVRRLDKTIKECRMTIHWPPRAIMLYLSPLPTRATVVRGGTKGKKPRV